MHQIAGESIRQVDRGRRQAVGREQLSLLDPRRRVQVSVNEVALVAATPLVQPAAGGSAPVASALKQGQPRQGIAQGAGDIEQVSDTGTVPREDPAGLSEAREGDAEEQSVPGR